LDASGEGDIEGGDGLNYHGGVYSCHLDLFLQSGGRHNAGDQVGGWFSDRDVDRWITGYGDGGIIRVSKGGCVGARRHVCCESRDAIGECDFEWSFVVLLKVGLSSLSGVSVVFFEKLRGSEIFVIYPRVI
jgi:hypothetical protein